MKITEVSAQKKNPRRFNVFIDGSFAFGVDEETVVNFRLLPGKEIFSSDLEKLQGEAAIGQLLQSIYRFFSIRARSEKEIRDYLRQISFKRKVKSEKEISDLAIDQVIDRLKKKDLINDEAFALTWTESRRRSKKLGPRALRVELMKKGIERSIIDSVLNDDVLRVDNEKLALEALEKKLRIWKKLPTIEFRRKATSYLLRRGFDYGLARSVVEKSLKEGYNND